MCEISDDNQFMIAEKKSTSVGRSCMKCEEKAVLIIRVNDAFCRNCFIHYMTHKFRSAIGKGRLVLYDEKVLLAYSGGHSSCAMLHLVQQGFLEHVHKKLRFFPCLAHIDEAAVTDRTIDERSVVRQEIATKLNNAGIPFHIVSLEQVMGPENDKSLIEESLDRTNAPIENDPQTSQECERLSDVQDCEQTDGNQLSGVKDCGKEDGNQLSGMAEKLKKLFASVKTLTAKEDLLWRLRHQLLIRVARHHGCSKIMLADSGSLVSVRILANISQGRGAALALDTGFMDGRHGDIAFIRPLKEFTRKEIVLYNEFHDVKSMFVPSLTTKAGSGASINLLTEQFVNGLQAGFPSTISTICRTGEKLCSDGKLRGDRCLLCNASLDTLVPQASALNATTFSLSLSKTCKSKMSRSGPDPSTMQQCCGDGNGSCHTKTNTSITADDMKASLCYGCQVTMRDFRDVNHLPDHLTSAIQKRMRRSQMKEEIEEFLLNDEEQLT